MTLSDVVSLNYKKTKKQNNKKLNNKKIGFVLTYS